MLDANSLIELLAGTQHTLAEKVGARAEGEIGISAIVFAEVAVGSWMGKPPSPTVLDQLARQMPVLPFDHLAAKRYAQLSFRRGSFDRLIAAHALALDLTLITRNERDFADVAELRVENWTLPQ